MSGKSPLAFPSLSKEQLDAFRLGVERCLSRLESAGTDSPEMTGIRRQLMVNPSELWR